jgi:hypothetical protein
MYSFPGACVPPEPAPKMRLEDERDLAVPVNVAIFAPRTPFRKTYTLLFVMSQEPAK